MPSRRAGGSIGKAGALVRRELQAALSAYRVAQFEAHCILSGSQNHSAPTIRCGQVAVRGLSGYVHLGGLVTQLNDISEYATLTDPASMLRGGLEIHACFRRYRLRSLVVRVFDGTNIGGEVDALCRLCTSAHTLLYAA